MAIAEHYGRMIDIVLKSKMGLAPLLNETPARPDHHAAASKGRAMLLKQCALYDSPCWCRLASIDNPTASRCVCMKAWDKVHHIGPLYDRHIAAYYQDKMSNLIAYWIGPDA